MDKISPSSMISQIFADHSFDKTMEYFKNSKLLTRNEVMEVLQCSGKTIRRMEIAGTLPRVQLSSKCIRYEPKEVEAIIKGLRVKQAAW